MRKEIEERGKETQRQTGIERERKTAVHRTNPGKTILALLT